MKMQKIKVSQKFGLVNEHWSPKIIAELNGQQVKVAKLLGEFDWHFHEHEDELFWIMLGSLEMHFRDQVIELNTGDMFVVPRGVEHKPVAKSECHVVLFEPASTLNTGNLTNEKTAPDLEKI